jgi:hypothetical protein
MLVIYISWHGCRLVSMCPYLEATHALADGGGQVSCIVGQNTRGPTVAFRVCSTENTNTYCALPSGCCCQLVVFLGHLGVVV